MSDVWWVPGDEAGVMFVALHDLRYAKGRFALMVTVIVLVAFLVGFLAALTGGLARASTSAVTDLPADRLAFTVQEGSKPDFTSSTVTRDDVAAWSHVDGVDGAEPLGVATTRASAGTTTAAVTAFGVESGSALTPGAQSIRSGEVLLSEAARDALGDVRTVSIGGADYTVVATAGDDSFSHLPVVWMNLGDWQGLGAAPGQDTASVVAIHGVPDGAVDGMSAVTLSDARAAIGSFTSENGSLRTISGFLVAISALVIGAFFSVWTVGRSGDIAVLKALGASTRYLLKDAIGQAAVILVGGVAAGTGLAFAAAAALSGVMPVVLDPGTFLAPAALLVVAGLIGAAAAVARITRIDPHTALAAR